MDTASMDPSMQWIFGNIILIWLCNVCVLFYASFNEPLMKDQNARINRLEMQNRAIGQALSKLNSRLTVPVRRDEILGLRYEIASLTAEINKNKNVNRRRIIESSDDDE